MRRKLALALAAAMTVGAITGCSGGGSTGKSAVGGGETTAAAEGAEL